MNGLLQDLRYAVRQLRKSPGFATVAILTLALGIGANTAIFNLLDQALLRSLPVKEPNRLVLLRFSGDDSGHSSPRGDGYLYFSYPMYRDLRDRNSVFNGLIATASARVGVQWHNQPELVDAELVSGNYFDILGVQAAFGRLILPSDDRAREASPVVVLGFDYWQRRFGADPRVVNQNISINGHPFTIVGVAQPGFRTMQEQIDKDLDGERVIAFLASIFGILAALMAAMGIYGVLAYSTAQRTREIGVRIAVGATRSAIVLMVIVEVLWLAGIGIAFGLPLSLLFGQAVRSQLFGISNTDPLTLGVVVVLVAAVALVSAVLPARRAAKVDPMVALRYE
jgi:ABC-type antimicrobial peptide transport system permease subunit